MSNQSSTASVIYKEIPGFIGYRAGSDGTIWSCCKHGGKAGPDGRTGFLPTWKLLTPTVDKTGRLMVCLRELKDGRWHSHGKSVHRLILLAFVGPCPDKMECCHNNGNCQDNRLDNLRWDTKASNAEDKRRHGVDNNAERNGRAKLTWDDIRSIRRRYQERQETQMFIAGEYGISKAQIYAILKNQTWIDPDYVPHSDRRCRRPIIRDDQDYIEDE